MCATTATNAPSCPDTRQACPPKTLVFFGSPHKNGTNAELLERYLAGADRGELTVINCYERAVIPCDDCRGCFTTVGCVKRDMDDLYALLEAADHLVFATPIYNRSFPAPMKAMLDRFQCYWAARFIHGQKPPIEKPKTAVLLTACGSERDDGRRAEEQLAPLLTILHARPAGAVHLTNADRSIDWQAVTRQLAALPRTSDR